MKWSLLSIEILFAAISLTGCDAESNPNTLYAVVKPEQAESLFSYVEALASENGLPLNPGRASDDRGNTLRVLEAKNWRVRLWMQNVPLSGHEDREICGVHAEPHPDPGQYVVTVSSATPLFGQQPAANLFTMLTTKLKARGFTILTEPKVCSAFSKPA